MKRILFIVSLVFPFIQNCDAEPVQVKPFGKTQDGREVKRYRLTSPKGVVVDLIDRGATIQSLQVPDASGALADIVLGFDDVAGYESDANQYFGCTVGRVCNRIAGAKFEIDGFKYSLQANDGKHTLHGGKSKSFDKVIWQAELIDKDGVSGVSFTYFSADGEEGFPGNMHVMARYLLMPDNTLRIDYRAGTDIPCPVNMTNHAYFNLAGAGATTIRDHELTLKSATYTPTDETLIPTGRRESVEDTPLDFRKPTLIGARIDELTETAAKGYDHNLVIDKEPFADVELVATLKHPASGRVLEVHTDQPGIQFYSGNFLYGQKGKAGKVYAHQSALCLETQHFPDSPNQPDFPSVILLPGNDYNHTTLYRFRTE